MSFLGDNGGLGLSSDQTDKVLQFQNLTGIEDMTICRDVLQRHQWNLEVAVQEQLNILEGRPSIYAQESRPPAVVSDHLTQHIYYTPPSDGSGNGLRGFLRSFVNLFWNVCYNTIMTFLQIGRRLLGIDNGPRSNPLQDILDFKTMYEEKYAAEHPVFYQGTFSQVLNDAKRELRFLLVYLHDQNASDADLFCVTTLGNPEICRYINSTFLFWASSSQTDEGRKISSCFKTNYFPFLGVLVLKENRMTLVGRLEGYCEPELLMQRLVSIVNEFEINLVQARTDRFEASLNRSLRTQQDEAFLESLRADQEKERKKEEERMAIEAEKRRIQEEIRQEEERRKNIQREKEESVYKVPEEPDQTHPDAIHVVFKLPDGNRLDRRFLKSHSLEAIFYFVFCHPNTPDSFEITRNFPKRVLHCRPLHPSEYIQTLDEAGLKNREVLFINDLDA